MRDMHSNTKVVQTLSPAVYTTDQNGAAVDCQGFDSIEHHVTVGVTGDTLSASIKLALRLQHGDLADSSDMADVTSANDVLPDTALTTGIFATIDDNAEDDVVVKIGYRGDKRYSRIVADFTGTHTNGIEVGAIAVKGHPHQSPVS